MIKRVELEVDTGRSYTGRNWRKPVLKPETAKRNDRNEATETSETTETTKAP